MEQHYTHILDLCKEATPPADGILSRAVYQDDWVKAVVFGFAAGHELSEHTASTPAILQFLDGEATLTLGAETVEARGGTWVHMPAGLQHAVHARTPVTMLLLLLKQVETSPEDPMQA
jgi:quercetin dioxygenase-like cupin family protein